MMMITKLLVIAFTLAIAPNVAMACWCNDSTKAPAPFEEAVSKANLIFVGTIDHMLQQEGPYGVSRRPPHQKGLSLDITDVATGPINADFDPQTSETVLGYKAIFKVTNVFKDTAKRIYSDTVEVNVTQNGGWCGYQFVKGQSYLVYARDGDHTDVIPTASMCSRTQPALEADTDIHKLRNIR